jgi:hypothetical protein
LAKALNLALNYVESRTSHEPYMVHGMVQGMKAIEKKVKLC